MAQKGLLFRPATETCKFCECAARARAREAPRWIAYLGGDAMTPCQQMLVDECEKAFGFLTKDHGFTSPFVHVDDRIGFLFVTYHKRHVGIECIWDSREGDISVKIIRSADGQRPAVYRADEAGKVWRENLTQILIHQGIRDIRFDPVDENGLSQQQALFRRALLGYARLLRLYGGDILDGSTRCLDALKQTI